MGDLGNKGCYGFEVIDRCRYELPNFRSRREEFENAMLDLVGRTLQICDWFRTDKY